MKAYLRNFRPMLTGASLAQDRGRMEARIEALTAEVSGLKKECQVNLLGHFGVRKFLAFITRLSAKHFLWQRVFLHANKNSSMYISMTPHWVSLRNNGLGQLENGLSNDVFQRCASTGSGLFFPVVHLIVIPALLNCSDNVRLQLGGGCLEGY